MTCNHDQTHDHRHDCDHDLHDHDDYRLTFDVVNPYSEALIESVANCGAAETDLAIGKVLVTSDIQLREICAISYEV